MNKLILTTGLALALVTGCCGHTETLPPDGGPDAACLCDCPDGPPPEGQISAFCLNADHDGKACCRGGGNVGTCIASECVAAP